MCSFFIGHTFNLSNTFNFIMLASIREAHPNFGRTLDVTQTMARFSNSRFGDNNSPIGTTNNLAPASYGSLLDNEATQFVPPKKISLIENMTNLNPPANESINSRATCESARRHWNACSKCRQREYFMTLLEMIAYILTGVMLIITMKQK